MVTSFDSFGRIGDINGVWLVVAVYKYKGGGVGTGMFLDWQEKKKQREAVED